MNNSDINKKMNLWAFWPAIICLAVFIFSGIFYQKQVGDLLNKLLYGMADYFGWYINLLSVLCVIIILVFVIYKYGDIKIGGEDAKPEFKTFNWCAMTICGGIGTGLLFWAMGEPIFHFATPPAGAGVEPFSREAGIFAISQAMWDWSFIQYSMYSLCAVAFAIITFNRKKDLSFGSLIERVFGKKIPWLNTAIHGLVIFCLCGAVANSMGVGLMQIGAGIEAVFGVPQSVMIWLVVAVVIGIFFILSCISGIGNGLKRVSAITMYVFFFLLAYVLVFGDTVFMGKISAEAIGSMIDNWGSKTLMLNTMAPEDTWSADWIIQYWASFIVYAPVIGLFMSRMAKGRTIRQFVLINVLVPSFFCIIWIGIFGGMTISLQHNGVVDVWNAVNTSGMQSTVFLILSQLPMGNLLTAAFLIAICFSFVTLADPMASVLATLSVNKLTVEDEAPKKLKIVMGVIITTVSYLLVASGGVNSVKGMFVLIGLLISLVLILCIVAAFKLSADCINAKNHGVVENVNETDEVRETNELNASTSAKIGGL